MQTEPSGASMGHVLPTVTLPLKVAFAFAVIVEPNAAVPETLMAPGKETVELVFPIVMLVAVEVPMEIVPEASIATFDPLMIAVFEKVRDARVMPAMENTNTDVMPEIRDTLRDWFMGREGWWLIKHDRFGFGHI
jgi:hypothetical protein